MKSRMRIDWMEVAGSFGDLETFLPLALGLITVNGMNPTFLFLSVGSPEEIDSRVPTSP